jgi:hypothetical protein
MPIALAIDTAIALFKRFRTLIPLALLAMAMAVQTARIEGFLWFDGLKADLAECKANHAREVQEAEQARAIAKAKSDQLAKESTRVHEIRAPENRAAAVRYIERNRIVRTEAPASEARAGDDPGAPAQAPADAIMVAVSSADILACTDASTYALDAWEWIEGLRREGLGE